ncbi:MAG: hypothetical protein ABSA72_01190 [Nitrososphaerales archaeon]
MVKQAYVVLASLVTFFIPNAVALGVWFLAGGMDPIVRSLGSILVWVLAFGLSTQLFWRLVQGLFRRDTQ